MIRNVAKGNAGNVIIQRARAVKSNMRISLYFPSLNNCFKSV